MIDHSSRKQKVGLVRLLCSMSRAEVIGNQKANKDMPRTGGLDLRKLGKASFAWAAARE